MVSKSKNASVVDTSKYDYDKIRVRDKSGKIRHSASNGDAVAKAMLVHLSGGGDIEQVIRKNKLEVKTKGKNAGLVRMSVGIALRAKVKAGEPVQIGKLEVKSLKQAVAVPKVEAIAPRKKAAPRKRKAKASAVAQAA